MGVLSRSGGDLGEVLDVLNQIGVDFEGPRNQVCNCSEMYNSTSHSTPVQLYISTSHCTPVQMYN